MPHRFYCNPLSITAEGVEGPEGAEGAGGSGGVCRLDAEESRHARKVLRLAAGAAVELFDGEGRLAEAVIESVAPSGVDCRVTAVRRVTPAGPWLTLATAVPKGPRAVEMVNQLAQLGVNRWVPLACDRSVVEPAKTASSAPRKRRRSRGTDEATPTGRGGQLARYERAALAAAKQSGRPTLMQIGEPATPASVLADPFDLTLLLHPETPEAGPHPTPSGGNDLPWREAQRVLLLVGPEGGWTLEELRQADAAGARRWSIGDAVLRIETAAAAGAALVRYLASTRD